MNQLGEGILGERRPAPELMKYYALECLLVGPLYPFFLLPRFFRYHSLRYRFDEEGVSMAWGILFHRQVSLTYGRIQDIHLQSNLIERRLGLAKIKIQTAAGSATAEMSIEGLHNYEQVRDFLYSRMRGARGMEAPQAEARQADGSDELTQVLAEVAAELRGLREDLRASRGGRT